MLAAIRSRLLKQYLGLDQNEREDVILKISARLKYLLNIQEQNPRPYDETFRWLEQRGVFFTPNAYGYPIPDTHELAQRPDLFSKPSELIGIDLGVQRQLHLLMDAFPLFEQEYNDFPLAMSSELPAYAFYLNNGVFDGLDALVLYCMIRHFRPEQIIEVGSGWSSRVSAKAALVNGNTRLTCIEPYPDELLRGGFPGLHRLITSKVEDLGRDVFDTLGENDILFIDTTHVIKSKGDVNYLILDILPRLKKGVIIHLHDIYIPYEYTQWWITEQLEFWNEQYLVQAFLAFNDHFQILMAINYLRKHHVETLQKTFPYCPNYITGQSLWLKKVK